MNIDKPYPATHLLADPSEVGHLDDVTIQWLLRQGVSISAIAAPRAVRPARVVFDSFTGRYAPTPLGEFALVVAVMADPAMTMLDFQVVDLVAWSPRSGQIGTRLGEAFALGEERIGINEDGTTGRPIAVHRTPLGWLRDDRRGIVIADWTAASFALSGLILQAEDDRHRTELLRRLTPVSQTTVVSSERRAAA